MYVESDIIITFKLIAGESKSAAHFSVYYMSNDI